MVDNPDQFTEVTTQSWLSRISSAFAGVIFGLLLFVVSFPVLWWNEGNSVENIRKVDEGRRLVVSVSSERIDPVNDGKLIHTSGTATTNELLSDPTFGVKVKALKLKRTVEMFQWHEKQSSSKQKNLGGSETTTKTYSYEKDWSETLIKSSAFKHKDGHENPTTMPYQSQVFSANDVTLGAFKLSSNLFSKMKDFENYPLSGQTFAAMEPALQETLKLNGTEYLSGDPSNTQIGSMRVRYSVVYPAYVSVIGKQDGNIIGTYATKEHGDIGLLSMGSVGAGKMFDDADTKNTLMTWGIRFGGATLMSLGLIMMLSPLKVLADVVPFIGSVVGAGTGMICGIVAFALSAITVAMAWIYYRPLIGAGLIVVAVASVFYGATLLKKAKDKISVAKSI